MKLKKVSYVYSEGDAFEKKALDEISLEIPDGQFIGIIGHTGSGKSTLIQHLNGLLRATSGAIYYDGENIYQEGYDMRTLRIIRPTCVSAFCLFLPLLLWIIPDFSVQQTSRKNIDFKLVLGYWK